MKCRFPLLTSLVSPSLVPDDACLTHSDCMNGGLCIMSGDVNVCACSTGFTGIKCEISRKKFVFNGVVLLYCCCFLICFCQISLIGI